MKDDRGKRKGGCHFFFFFFVFVGSGRWPVLCMFKHQIRTSSFCLLSHYVHNHSQIKVNINKSGAGRRIILFAIWWLSLELFCPRWTMRFFLLHFCSPLHTAGFFFLLFLELEFVLNTEIGRLGSKTHLCHTKIHRCFKESFIDKEIVWIRMNMLALVVLCGRVRPAIILCRQSRNTTSVAGGVSEMACLCCQGERERPIDLCVGRQGCFCRACAQPQIEVIHISCLSRLKLPSF